MKKKSIAVLYCSILILSLYHYVLSAGFTELAGDLPKVLSADNSPYIVVADIYVPAGRLVRIEPGVTVLFRNFTSMHITGVLHVKGSESLPVVFSSENDYLVNPGSSRNPTPYDWNGIYIHKDGFGTDLKNFQIKYSVKGILSDTKYIRITNGTFVENGRANLTIEGSEMQVIAGEKFRYDVSVKDAKADGIPLNFLSDPATPKRNMMRYSGLTVFAGGSVFGVISSLNLRTSYQRMQYLSNGKNVDMLKTESGTSWDVAKKQYQRHFASTLVGFSGVIAGAFLFTWSFTY